MTADLSKHRDDSREQIQHALATTEARMRALLEAAVDGVISIDARGVIQTANSAAERMFRYAKDELVGRNVKILMPSPYQENHDGYLTSYLETGKKKIIGLGREVVGLRKDGTTFPLDISVAEAPLQNERVFVGILRDISERKQVETCLRESNERLKNVVTELQAKNDEIRAMTQQLWQAAKLASVGELAASIAHELNNPLATVTLRVESLLSRLPAEDPARRSLEIVDQEAKRMGELVSNLLQFSRRSEGQISTVDVRQELNKSVELIQHHLRKRKIAVSQDYAPDTPIIYADRQKLRQVFLNLLTNASDAMPSGGSLPLRTAAASLHSSRPAVLVELADTGVGIAPENLERVMEPFFTTKDEGKGTGLGLAICRRVVQEHHGTIHIGSEVGKGTTVRIVLPVKNIVNVERLRNTGIAE